MVEEILPKYMFVVHKSNFHSMTKRKKRVQGAPNTTQYQLTACQYLDFLGLYPLHKFGRIDEFRRRNPGRAIQIENSCNDIVNSPQQHLVSLLHIHGKVKYRKVVFGRAIR